MGEIKSSFELAMERLKERGLEPDEAALTDEQKRRIAEIRREFEAKLAELDIMKQSAVREVQGEESVAEVEARFAEQRASVMQELEKRVESVRRGTGDEG